MNFDVTVKCADCAKNSSFNSTRVVSNIGRNNYETYESHVTYQLCDKCKVSQFIQPERSKREDSQKCEMRCSEHCG